MRFFRKSRRRKYGIRFPWVKISQGTSKTLENYHWSLSEKKIVWPLTNTRSFQRIFVMDKAISGWKNSENHKEMQTESSTGLWPESSQAVSQWGREIAEKHTRGRISVLNVNIISYFNNEYLLLLIWHILCTLLDR